MITEKHVVDKLKNTIDMDEDQTSDLKVKNQENIQESRAKYQGEKKIKIQARQIEENHYLSSGR